MLDKYLNDLFAKDREAHPIEAADFEAWRANRITKRFFADISMHLIEQMENIGGNTTDECAMSAAQYQAIRRLIDERILDWEPKELESD